VDSKWHLDVQNLQTGEIIHDSAEFFISAIGRLNEWAYPDIPGLVDKFKGHLRHSSNWDKEYDYSGKRVAVIGNGASGLQIVPNILPTVGHLDHYIRSKVWISPTFRGGLIEAQANNPGGHSYSPEQRTEFKEKSEVYLKYRKDLETNLHGGFKGGILGSPENEATRALWKKTMSDRVGGDQEWLEKLIPEYAPGCKRPTPAPGYLEALQDPKTTFHLSPIVLATETGLVTADGKEQYLDAIIAATGHSNAFVPRFPIINHEGVNLQEKWSVDGPIGYPETYFGLLAPGFPNYFFIMQANGNGAGGTVPLQCELSATYIAKAIRKIQTQSYASLSPKEEAVDNFNCIVNGYFDDKALGDNCNSWFKQGKGNTRNLLAWPGSAWHRIVIQRDPRWEDFEYVRRKGAEKNLYEYFGNGWTEREKKEDKANWTNYLHEVGKVNLETLHESWNE
jgi:cation diffusion facilitator CzcD-associated flavoprotein CzcO